MSDQPPQLPEYFLLEWDSSIDVWRILEFGSEDQVLAIQQKLKHQGVATVVIEGQEAELEEGNRQTIHRQTIPTITKVSSVPNGEAAIFYNDGTSEAFASEDEMVEEIERKTEALRKLNEGDRQAWRYNNLLVLRL